jgi:hypothetical protein
MDESLRVTLEAWHDFYVVTGTAAAALTGLQFVVQTLITSEALRHVAGPDPEAGIAAFGTPTVVHFTLALVISAIMCMPWPEPLPLHMAVTTLGLGSLVYSGIVLRRALRQKIYQPQLEDWVWHLTLPAVAYGALLVAGFLLVHEGAMPFFVVAGVTLLLLCIAIHNAWDTVTFISVRAMKELSREGRPASAPSAPARKRRKRN